MSMKKKAHAVGFALPRPLPHDAPLKHVAAESLILVWTVLTTFVLIWPTWPTLAILGVVLFSASMLGHVPLSAVPIPPLWFWSGMIGGIIGAALGGGFWLFLRLLVLTFSILWGTSLLLWTHSSADLARGLRRLLMPLRHIGLPVLEWGRIMGLALRALPVLADQTQAVIDTALIRMGTQGTKPTFSHIVQLIIDVPTACLSAASRAARDTGRAMSMRGGLEALDDPRVKLSTPDLLTGILGTLSVAAIIAAHIFITF